MSRGGGDRRVDFLVAGIQKAGTTALFDYLAQLPTLDMPAGKELHFFDDEETVDWQAPDYTQYHAAFTARDRLWGEATPIYIYWPNALERVRAYHPAMKFIILIRDPIERAWSHWKMEYARGKETEPFAWCIREGRARMAIGTPYAGVHRVYSYVERGFYGRQLARLIELFPDRQILLVDSEVLKAQPDSTLATTAGFLGVDPPSRPVERRISRPAPDIVYPSELDGTDVVYLQRMFADEQRRYQALSSDPRLWGALLNSRPC